MQCQRCSSRPGDLHQIVAHVPVVDDGDRQPFRSYWGLCTECIQASYRRRLLLRLAPVAVLLIVGVLIATGVIRMDMGEDAPSWTPLGLGAIPVILALLPGAYAYSVYREAPDERGRRAAANSALFKLRHVGVGVTAVGEIVDWPEYMGLPTIDPDMLEERFRRPRAASSEGRSTSQSPLEVGEIGILFDIDGLGGGFYRHSAFRVLFKSLDPRRLLGCTLFDGDTSETLAGGARTYCVAVQDVDSTQATYIREVIERCDEEGLLAVGSRLLEGPVTARHPLVLAGRIDGNGRFVVKEEEGIGPAWAEGTDWTIVQV